MPFRVTVIGIKKREPGWWQVAGLCSSIIDGEPRARCARRQRAKVQAIAQELRYRREQPIAEQGAWLQSVLRDIYAIMPCPATFAHLAVSAWRSPNAGTAASAIAATNADSTEER